MENWTVGNSHPQGPACTTLELLLELGGQVIGQEEGAKHCVLVDKQRAYTFPWCKRDSFNTLSLRHMRSSGN